MTRIGSLFSGYGGLDMGVQQAIGGAVAWHSEIAPGACAILAHNSPHVPNVGDITAVDWADVPPIDVLTGGFPCQDVSTAGRRAGLIRNGDGQTRSGLWGVMADAIDHLRPALVVIENVRGLLSAAADSDVEHCPWCVGDAGSSAMRALGAVLADLADIGYDAQWCGLPASGVGTPHGRFRVFITAHPADAPRHPWRVFNGDDAPTPVGAVAALLPTPVARDAKGVASHHRGGPDLGTVAALLPTPTVTDLGSNKTIEEWEEWTGRMQREHGNGNGHGASLHIEALKMLPTPRATDGTKGGPNQRGSSGDLMLPSAVHHLLPTPRASDHTGPGSHGRGSQDLRTTVAWHLDPGRFGKFAPAVARWEAVLGRPAPPPTEPTGKDGTHRLSPRFVEWMMGLPDGHVTAVPGLTRAAQLTALGNGVVPQQAAAAITHLLTVTEETP